MHFFRNIKNDKLREITSELAERINPESINVPFDVNGDDFGIVTDIETELFSDVIECLHLKEYVLKTEFFRIYPKKYIPLHKDHGIGTYSLGIGIHNSDQLYMLQLHKKYESFFDNASKYFEVKSINRHIQSPHGLDLFGLQLETISKFCEQKCIIGDDAILTNTKDNYHSAANFGDKEAWMISFRLNEKYFSFK